MENESNVSIDENEYCRRISWLTYYFTNYRIIFPILNWSLIHDDNKLINNLANNNLQFEIYKGSQFYTYSEDDYDYCIITNYNQSKNNELKLSSEIYSIKCTKTITVNPVNVRISYPFIWNQTFTDTLGLPYYSHDFKNVVNGIFMNREKIKIKDKENTLSEL